MNLTQKMLELDDSALRAALCTVVAQSGSTPRKAGAKMLVIDDHEDTGSIFGSIGGGAVEHHIRKCAIVQIRLGLPKLVTTHLGSELAMCCGGEMSIFIDPLDKKNHFICFGAGHIAQALCPIMKDLGFLVSLVDSRRELLDLEVFSNIYLKLDDASIFALKNLVFGPNTYILVTTHDHALDQEIIEACLAYTHRFLGLVGSKRKALFTKKRLLAKNFLTAQYEQVRCPVGLNIEAQSPAEIAISIAAQIIQVKNNEALRTNSSRRPELAHGLSQSTA